MDKRVVKILRIVFVFLFGLFGIHKFIDKEYKMGWIYLFTGGLCGIGWIYDVCKEIYQYFNPSNYKSLMPREVIDKINEGIVTNIEIDTVNLGRDENCYYVDNGHTFKDKTITTGYTGRSAGVSIRIMKGLSYRTGGSGGKAIRETQRTTYNGLLYITNKRVIYTSTGESFDKSIDKITSVIEAKDGVVIYIGSKSYEIITNTHSEFMKVFSIVRNNYNNIEE